MESSQAEKKIETYQEFWPFYLEEHSHRGTRVLHVVGLCLGLGVAIFSVWTHRPILILAALGVGYSFAWTSHAVIEKNRPATFKYPLWSFLSDIRMTYLVFRGKA